MSSEQEIDNLLEGILVDAYGVDEQLWAFQDTFKAEVPMPVEGTVIGENVSVTEIIYDATRQGGLRATCRRADGKVHEVGLVDVVVPEDSKAGPYLAAYRRWMGTAGPPEKRLAELRKKIREAKAGVGEIDLTQPVELIVLGIKQQAARCRLVGRDKEITLRASGVTEVAPGDIVTVMPKKHWSYAGHPYLSGEITRARFDLASLNLTPLKLTEVGVWDPKDEYWGEGDEPHPEWASEIVSQGPRSRYEMEQVLPLIRPDEFHVGTDPIMEAIELRESGEIEGAEHVLTEILIADLRCLDAHAHLGSIVFERWTEMALRHFDVGRQIGELSLGSDFKGVLPWSITDNRPYLRCLHGYGFCLWRLKRFDEAAAVFTRMLWMNPSDNQGVRLVLNDVLGRREWVRHTEE